MQHDEKYIVFKREGNNPPGYVYSTGDALEDAVVIRTQDVFSAAGLSAYAHNIRAHCTLLREMYLEGELPPSTTTMIARLENIAGYFESCAQEAADRQARGEVKVPD